MRTEYTARTEERRASCAAAKPDRPDGARSGSKRPQSTEHSFWCILFFILAQKNDTVIGHSAVYSTIRGACALTHANTNRVFDTPTPPRPGPAVAL